VHATGDRDSAPMPAATSSADSYTNTKTPPKRDCEPYGCASSVQPPSVGLGAILRNVSERWTEVDRALEREFRFDDFAQALAFVNRVAELAEAANHHPDIEVHFNRVRLRWWTHSAGGITERDHELAARTSELI